MYCPDIVLRKGGYNQDVMLLALISIFHICAMHITFLVIKLDTRWQSFLSYDHRTFYNALEVKIPRVDEQNAPLKKPKAHHIILN